MKTWVAATCIALSLTACSGMTYREQSTLVGTGVGAGSRRGNFGRRGYFRGSGSFGGR